MKKSFILSLLFFLVTSAIYAGVDSDLHGFFDKLGFDSNSTAPRAHKGQEAGYYTGGSIFARTPVRDLQIMQVDLPGYRSGCGGIDLFAGGFSFINSDQLVTLMKNVMNNAKGYAFTLALESATPQLANVIKYLQEQAAKINAMSVNSCETAAGMVGSVWPRTQEAQRRVCADIGNQKGIFADYAEAKQKCSNEGKLSETLNKGTGGRKNTVFKEGNLAWKAIQQNGFLNNDLQLAELFMSLSGTIIVRQKGEGDEAEHTFITLPSLATNMKLLGALLNGGSATIYRCDNSEKCLSPSTTAITISTDHALKNRVGKTLQKMAEKFYSDVRIDTKEIGLMEATTLPIQKMLNVQMAFYKGEGVLDISSYSDIIAVDILFQYLNENLNIVRASTVNLQYPEEIMNKFVESIDAARKALRAEQKSVYAQITTTNSIVRQAKMIEDLLSSSFSEHMNLNMKWSKGDL
jgi:conjugative transfer pilus assembly protein TraH